jgi:excinuclease UvrABC helicase subunit UvrB
VLRAEVTSRKENLVEYGFRLLQRWITTVLDEFEAMQKSAIYVVSNSADYELQKTEGVARV